MDFARLPDLVDLGYHPDVPPAAWYWRNLAGDVFGPHVVIRCPHGVGATLGSKHAIAADGTVTPSIVWGHWEDAGKPSQRFVEGCCHVMGRLIGWTPTDAARPRRSTC